VLDERATAAAIRERIDWLLDGTADGQERVLYYSGHGAQLPDYNAAEKIDHVDECLVPYDFHWTQDSAITDDDFLRYYSALPYAAKFFAIFDCCHSGGLTRDGARKIRAITPPDDIRHRILRWNKAEQMWEERDLRNLNPDFGGMRIYAAMRSVEPDFFIHSGDTIYADNPIQAEVKLATILKNVPTTFESLKDPTLNSDPHFKVFMQIFGNPHSSFKQITPIGDTDSNPWGDFVGKWEAGQVPDLNAGLQGLATQIDQQSQLG